MKKIILLALIITTHAAHGQTILQAIDTLRVFNNIYQTSPTCTGCVTHINTGHIADSTLGIMIRLLSLVSGAQGLNATLASGNIDTAQQIIGLNSSLRQTILIDPQSTLMQVGLTGGGNYWVTNDRIQLRTLTTPVVSIQNFGYGSVGLYSGSNYGYIIPGTLTSNRTYLEPDEGNGTGIASTLMLHTTKDPVTINNISGMTVYDPVSGNTSLVKSWGISNQNNTGDIGYLLPHEAYLQDAAGNALTLQLFGGIPDLQYNNGATGWVTNLYWIPPATGNDSFYIQDNGGRRDTISTLRDLRNVSNNFVAKANLVGQTAVGTICTYTVGGSNTSFRIGGYVNTTTVSSNVLYFEIQYVDENSNPITKPIVMSNSSAASLAYNINTNDNYSALETRIRAKASTPIIVKTILSSGSGSLLFDAGATIELLPN